MTSPAYALTLGPPPGRGRYALMPCLRWSKSESSRKPNPQLVAQELSGNLAQFTLPATVGVTVTIGVGLDTVNFTGLGKFAGGHDKRTIHDRSA